jgi:PmbA protein
MQDYRDLALDLVKRAKARGADGADVFITEGRSLSIELRLGHVEKLEEAGAEGLGIRVFKQGATALTYSSDLSPASLERLLDDTMSLAAVTDRDPANRLPDSDRLGVHPGPFELYDEQIADLSMERKLEITTQVEQVGLEQDSRINNSNGAWWSDGVRQVTLANSAGFVGSYRVSSVGFGVSLVAEESGIKQTDAWWTSSRFLKRLESAGEIGREAARRTLRKLGSRPVKTQTVPVVFDPLMGADFLKILFSAVNGASVYRHNSFLVDRMGEQIGTSHLNVIDDATLPEGLASRPFDAEGVRSQRTEVVKGGQLVNYLCDAYSAAKLNHPSTGSATRNFSSSPTVGSTIFYLEPGTTSPEDIIRSVKRGLYVTRLYWVGINQVTGDYSRGAEGIWIEDGELTHPVQEITIAGNMLEMMKSIEVIGNDLEFRNATASPTFLVSSMVVSGR